MVMVFIRFWVGDDKTMKIEGNLYKTILVLRQNMEHICNLHFCKISRLPKKFYINMGIGFN